jgi:hypothetical protein
MKLYYWPRTRAFTSLWMMEEVGKPYELVRVDLRAPDHPSAAHRQINPMGKFAGFQDGACAMGETVRRARQRATRLQACRNLSCNGAERCRSN